MKLLRIDSSARRNSISRQLTDKFVEAWQEEHPRGEVIERDLAKTHLPLMLNYLNGLQNVQMWLKDYKPEEGVLFPHTITWIANGNLSEEFQASKFKINPKFSDAKFQR